MPQINNIRGLSGIQAISKCVKSIRQVVFKLPRSQTISCIGYNVNLQTDVAAILMINSFRGFSNIKAITKYEVNQINGFRDIVFKSNCGRTARQMDGQGHSIIRPVFRRYKAQWFLMSSLCYIFCVCCLKCVP